MSALTDALAEVETDMRAARKIFGDIPSDMDDWAIVAAAARLVAEADPIWWCQEHSVGSDTRGLCTAVRYEPGYELTPCRMVRRRLLPPEEETP